MTAGETVRRLISACLLLLFVSASSMCIAQLQTESSQPVKQSSQPANTEEEIWISPNDPTHGGATDFWDMFQPGADWAQAEHHVRVVGIAQNLVTNGPTDKLKSFYAFLKANHIKLAVGIGMLTWSDQCGKHIEGYVPPASKMCSRNCMSKKRPRFVLNILFTFTLECKYKRGTLEDSDISPLHLPVYVGYISCAGSRADRKHNGPGENQSSL